MPLDTTPLDKEYYINALKSMIDSCFCYSYGHEKGSYGYKEYILPYQNDLGKKLFEKTYNDHLKTLDGCSVEHDTYEDAEGCIYNTIIRP